MLFNVIHIFGPSDLALFGSEKRQTYSKHDVVMLLVVSFFASSVLMNVLGWLSPGNSLTNHFTFCITPFQQADFFLPAGVNSLHFIAGRYIAVNFRFSWGGDRPGPVDG